MTPSTQPRILIARLSAIGDVVHGLPVLCALRDAMPRAFLAWVVESRAAELLRGHPALDALVEAPRGWLRSPRATLALRRQLRALHVDTTIDLQGLSKSAIAARLSGAKRRIGFGGVDGREISPWLNRTLVTATATHVIDRNLQLLAPLDVPPRETRFGLVESPVDAAWAERTLASLGLARGRFAIINPGAGWKSKLWPTDRFAAVARRLSTDRALPTLVVWGGAAERAMAESIVSEAAGAARSAPPSTLLQLAAVARRAAIFVSSDTGPLHIAAAVGAPCVGLFGPAPAQRNGPYGATNIAIQEVLLQGSSRERRSAGPESMAAISVERVVAACQEILQCAAAA